MIEREVIKSAINAVLDASKNSEISVEQAQEITADRLADVFVAALQSITITIPPGAIQVAGSSTNQTNIGAIVLNNAIS